MISPSVDLKRDVPAGIVVFLVALPLCLGVALASGAPLISGVMSGIIGGLVVGVLSKSHTSVSGPAAGLAAVVLSSIASLGSFELFLCSVLIAGFIQILLGVMKAGLLADFIPNNVIKGLLAAIGIILILKQIPHAIGFDSTPEDDFSFNQTDGENTFSEILKALNYITPGAAIIGFISIAILIVWDKTPLKKFRFFPASLFVVALSVVLNYLLGLINPELLVGKEHLVQIPNIEFNSPESIFYLPDTKMFLNTKVWVVGLTIAVIASLETLLNIEAVDKIDPHKRYTPPNRELFAQGVGNIAAGLMGGIPVTSVIVRSSVNIQSDNASKLSTILHGVFMLISILALSPVMNMIPLSALASILIITGFKLTKPKLYIDLLKKGPAQFVPFIVTILAIIFTDLLIGVVVGLLVSIIFLLISNVRNPLSRELNKLHIGEVIRFELPNQVSFLNKATIKETLWSIPGGSKVLIDASGCEYIDDDIMELIEDFKSVVAGEKNIKLNIIGLKEKYSIKDQIEFTNVLDSKTQQRLTPEDVLNLLKSGNERFTSGKGSDKYHIHHVQAASEQQNPMAVLLGCIDSRTSPEVLFDAGIGDLLTIRIAGNIVNPEIIGSLEIAVKKLGARLIVVKGHSQCGAVALSLKNVMDENIQTVTSKIQGVASACGNYPLQDNSDFQTNVEEVCKANTLNSVKEILKMSPYLKKKIESKEIGLVSAYHDITSGIVKFDPLI